MSLPPLSMLYTLGVVTVVLLLPTIMGAGLCRLLTAPRRPLTAEDWIDAAFVGLGVIIIPLQIGVSFNLPIRTTAIPLAVVSAVIAGVAFTLAARNGASVRDALRSLPRRVFVVALAAYAIQGAGLFLVGADWYLGRAWSDQVNYIAIGQYLLHYPVSQAGAPGLPPFAALATPYLGLRIGQSVLLAFYGAMTTADLKALFEPTILLSPFLVVLAIYAIARGAGFPETTSLTAAGVAGILPAVAYVHLESFFSQAMALPLLLYVCVLSQRLVRSAQLGDFVKAALVVSSLASIYLELFPLVLACLLVVLIAGLFRPVSRLLWLVGCVLVIVSPLLFRVAQGVLVTLMQISRPLLGHIYPFAFQVEGLIRLWLGDPPAITGISELGGMQILAIGATILGYGGLLWWLASSLRGRGVSRDERVPSIVLALTVVGVACSPIAVIARDQDHPYQFYKLLLTIAPLLVIGVAFVFQRLRLVPAILLLVLIGIPAGRGTLAMAIASAHWQPFLPTGARYTGTPWILQPGFDQTETFFESQHDRRIVSCVSDDTWSGGYLNAWVSYFARDSRVWSLNRRMNDQLLDELTHHHQLDGFPSDLSHGVLFATNDLGTLWATGSTMSTVWRAGSFQVSEPTSQPFLLACNWGIRTYSDRGADVLLLPSPDDKDLVLASTYQGDAVLTMRPAEDTTVRVWPRMTLTVNSTTVPAQTMPDGATTYTFAVPVGLSRLQIRLRPTPGAPPNEPDPVIRLTDVRLRLGALP